MNQPLAFQLPKLSLVRVAGADAIKVLNGLCTAKLSDLKPGGATEAMFTDDRGRVLMHAIVALEPAGAAVWVVGQFPEPSKLVTHIDRFIFREAAQPLDVSQNWQALLLGLESSATWQQLAGALAISNEHQCASVPWNDHLGWLIHLPMTGPEDRVLLVPDSCAEAIPGWLSQYGLALGDQDELEDRRIRNFWPSPAEMNERTLPQELDRDRRAISFTKGCYLGQETVARLDAMGQVQKKLCLVELNGSPENFSGQTLTHEGKEVGQLHSVSPLQPAGKRLALASMRRGSMAPGSVFEVTAAPSITAERCSGIVVAHP